MMEISIIYPLLLVVTKKYLKVILTVKNLEYNNSLIFTVNRKPINTAKYMVTI